MPETGRIEGLAAIYGSPEKLLCAAEKARDAGWRRWDCHTPFPVHGLGKAMGLPSSLIPWIAIPAAFGGAVFAKTMQWWMSAHDFPLIIGGTPLFALPAFAPVTFELFVLFSALVTFASLLVSMKLLRWHSPLFQEELMAHISSDAFVLYLDSTDRRFSETVAREFLEATGAEEIRVIREDE